jgi:pyruvate/2-oxoglutarate/acetoin dehydrogenase E1 component
MAGIIHLLRGMHVLVPRDMTRAAGFYNSMLKAGEPAIVVEVLNGYRVKERMPANIGEITIPPGIPEVIRDGGDATIVTYGACVRIALEGAIIITFRCPWEDCGIFEENRPDPVRG